MSISGNQTLPLPLSELTQPHAHRPNSDLRSLGSNVVCSSYPCDELVGISSLRVFNVTGVEVTDTPKPCLCDSPLLGRDLHEVCHKRGWDKFWKAHKENTTAGLHSGTDKDALWADHWKNHWTDHWADYWSKFWTIRYSRTLSYGERASQSAALEAASTPEMKEWKEKLETANLINGTKAPCPDVPGVMLGHLPDEGGADSACATDPSLCSANAGCIAVSTTHRYVRVL